MSYIRMIHQKVSNANNGSICKAYLNMGGEVWLISDLYLIVIGNFGIHPDANYMNYSQSLIS